MNGGFQQPVRFTECDRLELLLLKLNPVAPPKSGQSMDGDGGGMFAKRNISSQRGKRKGYSTQWVKGFDSANASLDDKALAVFQADVLIPDQFLATYKRTIHLDAEKALMFAVLHDAFLCLQEYVAAYDKRRRRLFAEAEEWIEKNDGHYLFSFENICECLAFDASYLRRGLMRWKEQALARVQRHGLTI